MHYDETLTLDHNEAFNLRNVEWRPENVPNLLFCVQCQVALASKRGKKGGCRNLSALSFFFFFYFLHKLKVILLSYSGSFSSFILPIELTFTYDFVLFVKSHLNVIKTLSVIT